MVCYYLELSDTVRGKWGQQDSNLQPRDYESTERAFVGYHGLRTERDFSAFVHRQCSTVQSPLTLSIEGLLRDTETRQGVNSAPARLCWKSAPSIE
jgi:hypothetical protein